MSGVLRGRSSVRISLVAVVMAALTFGFAPVGSAATKVDPVRILNSLPVSSEATSGYSRALFSHWSDLDADGCDTREEVLIQERVSGQVSGCKVVNGKWVSQFDGVSTTNSSNFDIDHFVPLKESWNATTLRQGPGIRVVFDRSERKLQSIKGRARSGAMVAQSESMPVCEELDWG